MSTTRYAHKKLLDAGLGKASFTLPTLHLGLFTASPGELGILTSEASGGGYARVEATSKMGATDLDTGIATNSSLVVYPTPTANWSSGTAMAHWGLIDSATLGAGNVWYYGELPAPFVVVTSSPVVISEGTIIFRRL